MRAAHARLAACSAHFAALIVFAHLLVAAHTAAHFYQASFEGASQHCAICTIGKHPADIPAAVIPAIQPMPTRVAGFASPPAPSTRWLDGAAFARAPPSAAPLLTTG